MHISAKREEDAVLVHVENRGGRADTNCRDGADAAPQITCARHHQRYEAAVFMTISNRSTNPAFKIRGRLHPEISRRVPYRENGGDALYLVRFNGGIV